MNSVIINKVEIVKGSQNELQSLSLAFLNGEEVEESSKSTYRISLRQFLLWIGEREINRERNRDYSPEKTNLHKFITENKISTEEVYLYSQRTLQYLTRVDIIDFIKYLEKVLKLSSLTVGSYLIAVKKFYRWTEGNKLYPDIAKGVKAPKRSQMYEKQYLSDEKSRELLSYFETVSLRDYAIVNLMLRTGLRTIEVARATIGDITFIGEKRVLNVWGKGKEETDKGKDYNFVVLTDKAYLPIRNYLEAARKGAKSGEPLFTSVSPQNQGEGLTTRSISELCKKGLKAIGLDGKEYTAHSLRHTTACSLLEHGANLIEVQHVLRHSNVNTTQIYTKMKEREQRLRNAPESALDNAF